MKVVKLLAEYYNPCETVSFPFNEEELHMRDRLRGKYVASLDCLIGCVLSWLFCAIDQLIN